MHNPTLRRRARRPLRAVARFLSTATRSTTRTTCLALPLGAVAQAAPADEELPRPLYQPITIEVESQADFDGHHTGPWGSAQVNPFLHCRFDVYLDHANLMAPLRVPGYFAGDGDGGQSGNVWRAHFTPTFEGDWFYLVVLEGGPNLNAALGSVGGSPMQLSRPFGAFTVGPVEPSASGFRKKGVVAWERSLDYYEFTETSAGRFVQVGVGSPENFLGYAGFEDAADGGSSNGAVCCCRQICYADCARAVCQDAGDPAPNFLHRYDAHVGDWNPGDPDWDANGQTNQGRGIIGALNYLGDTCGVNSMYVLVMNLGGDGKDTHPFLTNGGGADCPTVGGAFDPAHTLNYHVARLDQWRTVLQHANDKGILVQLLLAEQEACNIRWFGPHESNGAARNHMSLYRRLFMKQMVAHFAHLPGLRWNLCEENKAAASCAGSSSCGVQGTALPPQFTAQELDEMARWIGGWDVYNHPIGVHTEPNDHRLYAELLGLPAFPVWLASTSLQIHGETGSGDIYESRIRSAESLFHQAGWNLPIVNDEQGTPGGGLSSQFNGQADPFTTADDRRKRVLYDVLLSGGHVSYYFGFYGLQQGGGDLNTEDFRTREDALLQMGFARRVVESVRIWDMDDADGRIVGNVAASPFGRPEVAAAPDGSRMLVYYSRLTDGSGNVRPGQVDLSGFTGTYGLLWMDPRERRPVASGGQLPGGGVRTIPVPDVNGGAPGHGVTADTDLLLIVQRL